jgi:hypothetical protein
MIWEPPREKIAQDRGIEIMAGGFVLRGLGLSEFPMQKTQEEPGRVDLGQIALLVDQR